MKIVPSKLYAFEAACQCRQQRKQEGKKVVLTNGCFDLLHVGHIFSLEQARRQGDSLWIALNADESVRALKGPQRPFYNEQERAYLLSALTVVEGIFIFHSLRLDREIRLFAPDVYVKSGDYTLEKLDPSERQALQEVGAHVHFAEMLEGFSTTQMAQKWTQSSCNGKTGDRQ